MTKTLTKRPTGSDRRKRWFSTLRWFGFLLIPALLVLLVAVSANTPKQQATPDRATPFELVATNGQMISLDEALAAGDALLYFSMGTGCDGCFAQIPELEQALNERGITLVPIMVNPPLAVAAEAARFGIEMPILIDADLTVSRAYGMIGVYGHADRPSHSFALVRQTGEIAWVRHYAEMFVPAESLFDELDAALGT
ncbi:MAG: redoxin family protein [Acidimicrobiia bacterium]|nr:redoxin family protein [Acidimicrobiia bacterium]